MLPTILIAIIIILSILLLHKKQIDYSIEKEYKNKIEEQKKELSDILEQCRYQTFLTETAEKKYNSIIKEYKEATAKNQQELNDFFENQKAARQKELDQTYNAEKTKYELLVTDAIKKSEEQINALNKAEQVAREEIDNETQRYKDNLAWWQQHYESILEPIKLYEKEQQEKLFYTIQLPDEYKEDIEFLLTTVAAKVEHPDIISKLVWAEYVKPYLDDTFKRVGVEDKSGIYKITNINSGKAYIGKSTNVKKRLADHFKSSVGIKSIADQAVHHAILKEGFWNWAIEVITYCDKEQLNEMEKYYIDFFKTQEFGFNKNSGGGG